MIEWVECGSGLTLAKVDEELRRPCVAAAVHAGHVVRSEIERRMVLSSADRLREEDPFTASFAPTGVTLIEAARSRFEFDLNRDAGSCVYETPDDAWGMTLWSTPPSEEEIRRSREAHVSFYRELDGLVRRHERELGRLVFLDLHSYNHRRGGPVAPSSPVDENPEVNLGTRHVDRSRWAPVIDAFLLGMRELGFDARENVKFGGGHLSAWVAGGFANTCPLAIEFKKTFMDEWTGEPDPAAVARIRDALTVVIPDVESALAEVRS